MQKRILSLLVDNTQVCSVVFQDFSAGEVITLTVFPLVLRQMSVFSRMTVVCSGDALILEQITKQLAKAGRCKRYQGTGAG